MVIIAAGELPGRSARDVHDEQMPAAVLPADPVEARREPPHDARRVAIRGARLRPNQPGPFATLVSHEIGRHDPITQERYIPNRIRSSRARDWPRGCSATRASRPRSPPSTTRPRELILKGLQVRQIGKTNMFSVTLEGRDPRPDQEPPGVAARGIQEPGTVREPGPDGRHQDLCQRQAENAQDRPRRYRPTHLRPTQDCTHHRPGKEHL